MPRRIATLPAITASLRTARSRVRWSGMWRRLALILPVVLLLAAAWFALMRFTLLDIPAWPAAALFGGGLLVAVLYSFARRVPTSEAARFLDKRLELDERLTSFLELSGRLRYRRLGSGSQPPVAEEQVDALGHETARLLKRRRRRMPARLDAQVDSRQWWAIGLALLAFGAAIFTPSELDAVRADREALRQTVAAQIQGVRDLKADIVARPNLPDDVRKGLLSQLDALQNQLAQPGMDRASILAALSDTQDKLRSLTPYSTSEFTSLIRAAQMVQEAAVTNASWDPATTLETTDLAKGAAAAEAIADALPQFGNGQMNDTAQRFTAASNQAAAQDARISQKLAEISADLRERSRDTGAMALRDVADQLRAAGRNQQLAESVEQAMSKLDEGKQTLAQSEQSAGKKPQVGFRRGDLPGATTGTQATGTQGGEQQTAEPGQLADGQSASSQQAGPGMGANVPAFGQPGSSTGGSTSQTTGGQSQAGAGGPSSQGGQTGASTGQQQSGGTGSGTSSGAGSGGAGGTGSGTMQGSLTGPVTGGGGAISRVPNPEGVGVGGTSSTSGSQSGSQTEQVYVPTQNGASGSATGGDQGKSNGSSGSSEPGATGVGTGGKGAEQGKGPGALTQLRTPYTDVVREYAQRATDALERAYVPPDAKEYVKNYFAQLGKQ